MKKEFLLVTSIFPPQVGGPAIFTARFKDWLEQSGTKTHVISYSSLRIEQEDSIRYVDINKRFIAFVKFIYLVKKYSDRNTFILCNGAFIETFLACLLNRRKYVAKIPGDPLWEFSVNRSWTTKSIEQFQNEKLTLIQKILRQLFNLAFSKAESVVVPSKQLGHFLEAWGVDKHKIKLIYNCVDPKRFKNLNLLDKKYDLITVCRLVPWKGVEELITLATELNLKLAIVGDGPLLHSLKNDVKKERANIIFLGTIENSRVVKVLNESKIFVLNSAYEATSYALIEAKMCGLPVIANESNGSLTLVQGSVDGFIVKSNSREDLKYYIEKLIMDEKIREDFGLQARKDALIRFNQEINFAKILHVMKS